MRRGMERLTVPSECVQHKSKSREPLGSCGTAWRVSPASLCVGSCGTVWRVTPSVLVCGQLRYCVACDSLTDTDTAPAQTATLPNH
eukprot:COSAG02_NODE_965_length_15584_cov_21.604312_4_plen_86_part_00